MSQKRVAVVLASLVGTLTISAGALLLMEGGALGNSPLAAAYSAPDIAPLLETAAPLPQSGWNYIIIYESGDVAGSSSTLADGRLTGGSNTPNSLRPKANFHFVIDNARNYRGAVDGDLEVSQAWKAQSAGAPVVNWSTKYSSYQIPYYNAAVGVCLIGDLRRESISGPQQQKLSQLVRELQHRFNVPADHVLFEWELNGFASPVTQNHKALSESLRNAVE